MSLSALVGFFFTENQTAQLVAQALGLLGIPRGTEALGELEEGLLSASDVQAS